MYDTLANENNYNLRHGVQYTDFETGEIRLRYSEDLTSLTAILMADAFQAADEAFFEEWG